MNKVDFLKMKDNYDDIQDSEYKINLIKNAIKLADEEKDYDWQLIFRDDYIKEVVFNEDIFKALIIFPEFLSIYDKYEDELDIYGDYDMLWVYKWILGSINDFYQISNEEIEKYFEDFKKRCQQYGYSLRSYYYFYADYIEVIDKKMYNKIAFKFLRYKKDLLADCEACELDRQVYYEIHYGDINKALKKAEPILNGIKKCAEVPEVTYGSFLKYYIGIKDKNNSSKFENLLYKKISKNKVYIKYIGTILEYCSIFDIDKGLKIFQTHLSWDLECRTPKNKFWFELGAYKLFKSIKEKLNKDTIKIILNKKFPLYKEDGVYIIDEIINYYEEKITDLAQKFDKKNGNDYLIKEVNQAKNF